MESKYDNTYIDRDIMKTLIDSRNKDCYFIPLYINLFGTKYAILDMDNITLSVPLSAFRVGFGTSHSIIGTKNFPTGEMYKYNCEDSFKITDEDSQIDTHYFIIEESFMNDDSNPIDKEINNWIKILYDKSENHVKEYKESLKSMIDADNDPQYSSTTEDDEYYE